MPKSAHIETGRQGENAAAAYLQKKGWRIAERNWRLGRCEIDIIAWTDDDLLVFVEVKTRSGGEKGFGVPQDAVNTPKMERLLRAAGLYMEKIGYDWEIRFDTIAIWLRPGSPPEIIHIEDAYFPMF